MSPDIFSDSFDDLPFPPPPPSSYDDVKDDDELLERISRLEKRVELLEDALIKSLPF